MPAAYPVALFDRRGRMLARGRTANISETGCFIIIHARAALPADGQARIEMVLPSASARPGRPDATRTVLYACRIARRQAIGQMTGLGIELLRKLG